MQSGYGVSEMQQFMVDGGCSPLFTISTADIHHSPQPQKHLHSPHSHHQQQQQPPPHHHHQHLHQNTHPHHHHHHQQQQPPPLPQQHRFHHSHQVPITQQLFQQTHQFQLFQQEQQRRIQQQHHHHNHHLGGLDQNSGPENSHSPTRILGSGDGGPPFLGGMNFRLGVNNSSREGLNNEEGILEDDDGSESRVRLWPGEEGSAIKEPFWRPLDIDNRKCKGKHQLEEKQHCKRSKESSEEGTHSASNYKLFSELEAICKTGVGSGGGNNHQTGSGSALTGENTPMLAAALGSDCQPNVDAAADHGSDTSTGKEASLSKKARKCTTSSRRKRKRKQQLSSIAMFFENLVNQLMDHQEGLHRNFFEVMERRDQERMNREESWRKHEALKVSQEAMVRAQEQALASTREAAIISFLEKVTGERLNLPKKPHFLHSQFSEDTQKEETDKAIMVPSDTFHDYNNNPDGSNQGLTNPSRWPKAEVQALIRVRSSLESRFQEPGLKGLLWEEVSSAMALMDYHRSAKRCKEKWENINKYFRKTKDNAKKRPQTSKTCPYFQQLDQLYSKSHTKTTQIASSKAANPKENSQLLEAIVVSTDHSTSFKFKEMGSLRKDYNGKYPNSDNPTSSGAAAGQGLLGLQEREASNSDENEEDVDEGEDEDAGEEEGEGENQQEHHDMS